MNENSGLARVPTLPSSERTIFLEAISFDADGTHHFGLKIFWAQIRSVQKAEVLGATRSPGKCASATCLLIDHLLEGRGRA